MQVNTIVTDSFEAQHMKRHVVFVDVHKKD